MCVLYKFGYPRAMDTAQLLKALLAVHDFNLI